MTRPDWDETWFAVAAVIARRSLCNRDKVGAVIVTAQNRIVSTGYNGPPSGFIHEGKGCQEWCTRAQTSLYDKIAIDYSDCPSLHAEANALSVCDRSIREGGRIYVTSDVCFGCAKLIANSGLTELHVLQTEKALIRQAEVSYNFLEQCGVTVYVS